MLKIAIYEMLLNYLNINLELRTYLQIFLHFIEGHGKFFEKCNVSMDRRLILQYFHYNIIFMLGIKYFSDKIITDNSMIV